MPLRSFGLVDYKIREAEYFLLDLARVGSERRFEAVQYCSSAFVSAARSVTFAMQSSLKDHQRFASWYELQQHALRANHLSRFFNEFRRVTQHIGESVVGAGKFANEDVKYYFVPCRDLPEVPEEDVQSACEAYFRLVLRVVYDCYVDFGPVVDSQWRYTTEYFSSIGKNIEDAEEELGFPRGWTDIGERDAEPHRWRILRNTVDGCGIEQQFARWLGLAVPRPAQMPPYHAASD